MNEVKQFKKPKGATQGEQAAITIDEVYRELEQWRTNKSNSGAAIPDILWKKIFQLTDQYAPAKIRQLMGISGAQFNRKAEQFQPPVQPQAKPAQLTSVDFSEVKTSKPVYQAATIPAPHTIIVEFRRSDGQLMKLHTTSENFKTIITLFFEMGHHAADHL